MVDINEKLNSATPTSCQDDVDGNKAAIEKQVNTNSNCWLANR